MSFLGAGRKSPGCRSQTGIIKFELWNSWLGIRKRGIASLLRASQRRCWAVVWLNQVSTFQFQTIAVWHTTDSVPLPHSWNSCLSVCKRGVASLLRASQRRCWAVVWLNQVSTFQFQTIAVWHTTDSVPLPHSWNSCLSVCKRGVASLLRASQRRVTRRKSQV